MLCNTVRILCFSDAEVAELRQQVWVSEQGSSHVIDETVPEHQSYIFLHCSSLRSRSRTKMIHFASACSMGFLRVTIAIFLCPMFSYLILGLQNLIINFPLPTTVGKAPIMIRILCASLFRLRCRKDGCSKCHLYRLRRKGGVTALPSAKCPWFFHLHVPRGWWWIPRYVARTMRAVSPSDILYQDCRTFGIAFLCVCMLDLAKDFTWMLKPHTKRSGQGI